MQTHHEEKTSKGTYHYPAFITLAFAIDINSVEHQIDSQTFHLYNFINIVPEYTVKFNLCLSWSKGVRSQPQNKYLLRIEGPYGESLYHLTMETHYSRETSKGTYHHDPERTDHSLL